MSDYSLRDLKNKARSHIPALVIHIAKYLFISALPEHQQDWVKDIQFRILPRIKAVTSKGLKIGFVKEEARAYVFDLNLPLLLKKEYNPSFQLRQPLSPELLLEATLHLVSLTDPVEETLKTYLKDVE